MRDGKVRTPPIDERPMSALPQAFADLRAGKVLGRVVLRAAPVSAI